MSFQPFAYLRFAKEEFHGAAYPLCLSGATEATLEDLAPEGQAPPVARPRWEDAMPLLPRWQELLSSRYGVPTGHISYALGASGAIHLALAAVRTLHPERGRVGIEDPSYEALSAAARYLGFDMVPIPRPREKRYAVDLEAAERALSSGAVALCLTDLHNPSGVRLRDEEVDALRSMAREHDAWVLLDEVYRDFLPGDVGTAYRDGERLICFGSLTKVYGVSGPRCGWVFAPPQVTQRIEELVEILHGGDPGSSLMLMTPALEVADRLLSRSRRAARRAQPVMDAWIEATPGVSWVRPDAGITGLVQVEGLTDSLTFARRLRAELDVQVVPGVFFGAEGSLRLSYGLPPAQLQKALEMLALGMGPLLV